MKTIIQGNADLAKDYKYFECKRCGWAGLARRREMNMNIIAISVKEIGQE